MAPIADSEFSSYHMKWINRFQWTGLTRSVICKGKAGYFVKPSSFTSQFVFYAFFVNTSVKLVFLAFVITGNLGHIEFLDKASGWDYVLCGALVGISYLIWQRHPLYEIIYRLWEVENRIYENLGNPEEIKWAAEDKHCKTVWAHALLTCCGCSSMAIQFYMDPKYCCFTYSLIQMDSPHLRILFCLHEVMFMAHAWFANACSNSLCAFEAVNLSTLIKQMGKEMDMLTKHRKPARSTHLSAEGHHNDSNVTYVNLNSSAFNYHDGKMTKELSHLYNDGHMSKGHFKQIQQVNLRSGNKLMCNAAGKYKFHNILYDYQQLMLISEQFNYLIGCKIFALTMIGYCQYVSSTAMAFQVLRMPGTGIGDIWFYIQDSIAGGTYLAYRLFDCMSIVLPSSEEFLNSVRNYQSSTQSVSLHLRKAIKALRPVSLKIGRNPVRRQTVLQAMNILINYYACAALWKL